MERFLKEMSYKIKIQRYQQSSSYQEEFEVKEKVKTLLEALYQIKSQIDSSLSFDFNCKSGICGACAVRVDGKEALACSFKLKKREYLVEPLRYYEIKRDLIVDKSKNRALLLASKASLNSYKETILTPADEAKTQLQSDCILCSSCYSSCPVVEVNSNFKGPFALSRVYRYLEDRREGSKTAIDAIQKDGIWDCTLCGECTLVCPQGIDPKGDILNLRALSTQAGYFDPNFTNMDFGLNFNSF